MTKRQFLFDFNVFGGNSGGPVYFAYFNRRFGNRFNMGRSDQKLIGVVSQQLSSKATMERLGLSVIVPASFIREVLDLLPSSERGLACEPMP